MTWAPKTGPCANYVVWSSHKQGAAIVHFCTNMGDTEDETISVYIMSIEELMEAGRSRLSRGFTIEECRNYLSLDSCPEES